MTEDFINFFVNYYSDLMELRLFICYNNQKSKKVIPEARVSFGDIILK